MHHLLVEILIALFTSALAFQSEAKNHQLSKISNILSIAPEGAIEDFINKTVEGLRPNIPDPLYLDHLDIVFPAGGELEGSLNISNLAITGLKGFQLTYLKFSVVGFKLNFTLAFPKVSVETDYKADAVIGKLIPVYGEGDADVSVNDIGIGGSTKVNLTDGISVSDLAVQIHLGSAVFNIHGLINNEDFSAIASSVLTDVAAKFINKHEKLVSDIVSPILETIINAVLGGIA